MASYIVIAICSLLIGYVFGAFIYLIITFDSISDLTFGPTIWEAMFWPVRLWYYIKSGIGEKK